MAKFITNDLMVLVYAKHHKEEKTQAIRETCHKIVRQLRMAVVVLLVALDILFQVMKPSNLVYGYLGLLARVYPKRKEIAVLCVTMVVSVLMAFLALRVCLSEAFLNMWLKGW